MKLTIHVLAVNYQRNGVCGRGFYTVRFAFAAEGRKLEEFIAVRFGYDPYEKTDDGDCACAVVSLTDPESDWRGDHFVAAVDLAIDKYKAAQDANIYGKPERAAFCKGKITA